MYCSTCTSIYCVFLFLEGPLRFTAFIVGESCKILRPLMILLIVFKRYHWGSLGMKCGDGVHLCRLIIIFFGLLQKNTRHLRELLNMMVSVWLRADLRESPPIKVSSHQLFHLTYPKITVRPLGYSWTFSFSSSFYNDVRSLPMFDNSSIPNNHPFVSHL